MKAKFICSIAAPALKWAAKELMQNDFLREYTKARILGASGDEAYSRAANFVDKKDGKCPRCGASRSPKSTSPFVTPQQDAA